MRKFIAIWAAGLFTVVPVATYYLLFKAETGQLALFLFIGFWVFGFWACFVPLYKLYRVRKMYKAVASRDDLRKFIENSETRDVAVDTLAKDSGIPSFIVEKAYDALSVRISAEHPAESDPSSFDKAA